MARIDQGILGPFSGKVGEVIGSSWKGIPYIKARPTQFHDAKTPRQLTHRLKLQTAHGFARSIKNIIEIGFRNVTGTQTPYNNAVSYLMKNALVGEYPEVGVDPSKVVVSQGKLAGAEDCTISTKEDGTITFTWGDASSKGNVSPEGNFSSESNNSPEDQAILLAYNFAQQQGVSNQVYRKDKSGSVKIPKEWEGDGIACYIFFASDINKDVSNSKFLGMTRL